MPPVLSGYLNKRAIRSGRTWKKRYFVLNETSLSYYKAESEVSPTKTRGQFPINYFTTVRESDAKEFGIEIVTDDPPVTLVLAADSEREQRLWLDTITRLVEVAKKAPPPLDTSHGVPEPSKSSQESGGSGETGGGGMVGGIIKKIIRGRRGSASSGTAENAAEGSEAGGTVTFQAGGTTFEVDSRYSFIRPIGHGAYGVVVSANDKRGDKEKVAIKKVSKAFEDLVDAKRILREIKLLRHFDHENIIHVKDLGVPNPEAGLAGFNDIYIVSELMETDLHRVIYSRQSLSDDHVQYFVYQVLRALKYIHSADVVHRDLKPSNLLLNSTCDLKVCDFGLARGLHDMQLQLTEYVVTRWYRAPEIMLACKSYTKAIDVWSLGCIFAELLGRKPLFPGEDYISQLKLIADIIGTPSDEELNFVTSEKALKFMRGLPRKDKCDWSRYYPKAPKTALDLLDKMLRFNPSARISVTDALAHPYLASLHHPDDEPDCPTTFSMRDDVPDDMLKKRDIQTGILEEVFKLHPEAIPAWNEKLRG